MQLKRLFCALKRKKKTSADIFQKCKKKMYYEKKHIRGFQIFFIVLDANQRSFTFCFPLNILKYSVVRTPWLTVCKWLMQLGRPTSAGDVSVAGKGWRLKENQSFRAWRPPRTEDWALATKQQGLSYSAFLFDSYFYLPCEPPTLSRAMCFPRFTALSVNLVQKYPHKQTPRVIFGQMSAHLCFGQVGAEN